ncbi:MAG: phosphatase PAP2 family protein, partial [Acidimicrobiia bacterium]|nr:phosphatase PAP2 family protein [Acidimicrobiia bacterium]
MARFVFFTARQVVAIFLAALAYFGVRGLTEGGAERAQRNAELLVSLEERLHINVELAIQDFIADHDRLLTLANWIYIFGHWPVIIATLVWLAVTRRRNFYELRNALFLSGAVGLVIFATWAVMPPRLFSLEYVDTVTVRSNAYRLLQPPGLINKYAALPSFHFGWNLLVGIMWIRATNSRLVKIAGVVMPAAMAFAVVATANHWIADVIVGGGIASAALVAQCNANRLLPHLRLPLHAQDP